MWKDISYMVEVLELKDLFSCCLPVTVTYFKVSYEHSYPKA